MCSLPYEISLLEVFLSDFQRSAGKASCGGIQWRRLASGHSFHVMAHIWLFGMNRTFPFQFPSRCSRMWKIQAKGWAIYQASPINLKLVLSRAFSGLAVFMCKYPGFCTQTYPAQQAFIQTGGVLVWSLHLICPRLIDPELSEQLVCICRWTSWSRQMGGKLSGFYRIQIKLISFKFLPSYVCLLKVAEIEFKSQKHVLAMLREQLPIANTWLRNAYDILGLHLG